MVSEKRKGQTNKEEVRRGRRRTKEKIRTKKKRSNNGKAYKAPGHGHVDVGSVLSQELHHLGILDGVIQRKAALRRRGGRTD
jgi:hypothetical protein